VTGYPSYQTVSGTASAAELNGAWRAVQYQQFKPIFSLSHTLSAASSVTGVVTFLTMDTEEKDTDGGHDASTNAERFTPLTPGLYRVMLTAAWDPTNTTNSRGLYVSWNPSSASDISRVVCANTSKAASLLANGKQIQRCSGLVSLAAGDFLSCQMFQDSTVSLTLAQNLYRNAYAKFQGYLVSKP
jgi:hypothetical protein